MCASHPNSSSDSEIGCYACYWRRPEADVDRSEHTPPFVQAIALKPPQSEIPKTVFLTPRMRRLLDERDPPLTVQNISDGSIYWRTSKKLYVALPPAYERLPPEPLAAKVMANYWTREMKYRAKVGKRQRKRP